MYFQYGGWKIDTQLKKLENPVFERHLNFGVKESPDKVSMGTVEKLALENLGIAFGILSLRGTKTRDIPGGSFPPPITLPIATYV